MTNPREAAQKQIEQTRTAGARQLAHFGSDSRRASVRSARGGGNNA